MAFTATDAGSYERSMGRWSRVLARHLLDFASIAQGRFLDVGCGTGSLTNAALARPGIGAVCGIDPAEVYVADAQKLADGACGRACFQVGDATCLPFADGTFDSAGALLVLTFLDQPRQAASEMRRVVRPGGTITAAIWDFRGGMPLHRMMWDVAATLDPAADAARGAHLSHPLADDGALGRLWRDAGLVAVEEVSITMRLYFSQWADCAGARQGPLGDYVRGLDDAARRRFEEAVRRAFLAGAPDGPRSFAATAFAVRGQVPS